MCFEGIFKEYLEVVSTSSTGQVAREVLGSEGWRAVAQDVGRGAEMEPEAAKALALLSALHLQILAAS